MDNTENVNITQSSTDTKENIKVADKKTENSSNEKFGYDLYDERLGDIPKPTTFQRTILGYGGENLQKAKCEKKVLKAVETHPMVQLMMAALKASGCEINLTRHIVCESCDKSVTGGYDTQNNQIVVCQNICKMESMVAGVLTHEMIHMFDRCRHKMDFSSLEHLACTEIRAANLTHCSFTSSMSHGCSTPFRIAKTHQDCVKLKAAFSVLAVRDVTLAQAYVVVQDVFPQCYADLEPIGRRFRKNSIDPQLAYRERHHYGY